jgi:hypothetical protein
MKRWRYDLSHFSVQASIMGSLQTFSCIPVVAGDRVGIDLNAVFRLAPLRRQLVMDSMVDLFAFYVPHRHIYGQDWQTFMLQGQKETVTFDTATASLIAGYLGAPGVSGTLPKWMVAGYAQIWNRYFRVPTDDTSIISETTAITTEQERVYGKQCARPKSIWSTGVVNEISSSDREVTVSGGVFDILDLERVKATYGTEVERQWFGQRYTDILDEAFGSRVNTDADERPTLLSRKTTWLSGYDVDGTSDASLGTYSGKSIGMASLNVPRRFFPEHGAIWIMGLVRFPVVHEDEIHYLMKRSQPTYKEITADPMLWENEPPTSHEVSDFFQSGAAVNIGEFPYGQWYRYHPSIVNTQLTQLTGYSFLSVTPGTADQARYCQLDEYATVFQSTPFGHWIGTARLDVDAIRVVPGPKSSMFAGTDKGEHHV